MPYINGLVQKIFNFIANALELRLSCTNPSISCKLILVKETIQSTPVISRLLGAKIRERELSGSPVISRCRAMATTREFRITDPHSQAFKTLKQYVEQ